MSLPVSVPVVMTLSGNDPTGGAGVQADIEAIASMGCHAAPVITTLTVQDTTGVRALASTEPELLIEQARAVLEDMPVRSFKIGLLDSVEGVEAIYSILVDYPELPVVTDPVLASGAGDALVGEDVQEAMLDLLIPMTTVLTPNSLEAMALTPGADTLDASAQELMNDGCEYVLITGGHQHTPTLTNILYGNRDRIAGYEWERLPGNYHGSGCTLASALAALLAHGREPVTAIEAAQKYAWETLKNGRRIGMGQLHPDRLFWARER